MAIFSVTTTSLRDLPGWTGEHTLLKKISSSDRYFAKEVPMHNAQPLQNSPGFLRFLECNSLKEKNITQV
jgi:hypothetical protein